MLVLLCAADLCHPLWTADTRRAFGTGCVIQCDKEDKGLIRLEGGPQQIASARRLIEEKIGQVSSPQRCLPTDRNCFFYGLPPGFYRRVPSA